MQSSSSGRHRGHQAGGRKSQMTRLAPQHPVLRRLEKHKTVRIIESSRTIEKSKIQDAIIRNTSFRDVKVDNSIINKAKFENSVIRTSKAHHVLFFDCKFDDATTLNHCQVIQDPLAFRRFPIEIRAMIFENAVPWENGRTPALIIGLRGDPELYHEALTPFYKNNEFRFGRRNSDTRLLMSPKVFEKVERIELEVSAIDHNAACQMENLRKVRRVHLNDMDFYDTQFCLWERRWMNNRETIEEFALDVHRWCLQRVHESVAKSFGKVSEKVDRCSAGNYQTICRSLQGDGKSACSFCYKTYIWKAEKGKTLVWNLSL